MTPAYESASSLARNIAAAGHGCTTSPPNASRVPIPLPLPRLGLYPSPSQPSSPPINPVDTSQDPVTAPIQNRPRAVPLSEQLQSLRTWNRTLQACLDVQKLAYEDAKEQLSAKDAAYNKLAAEHERVAALAKDVSDAMFLVQEENNALHHTDSALAVADATRLRLALEKETQDHELAKEERDEARQATRKLRKENIQLRKDRTGGSGKPVANRTVAKRPVRVPSEEV